MMRNATSDDLYRMVMSGDYCISCRLPEEVQSVLRFFDSYEAVSDWVIRRVMEGEEPEERWDKYLIVGKSVRANKSGVTLFSIASHSKNILYDEIAYLIDGGAKREWTVAADFAALLV